MSIYGSFFRSFLYSYSNIMYSTYHNFKVFPIHITLLFTDQTLIVSSDSDIHQKPTRGTGLSLLVGHFIQITFVQVKC